MKSPLAAFPLYLRDVGHLLVVAARRGLGGGVEPVPAVKEPAELGVWHMVGRAEPKVDLVAHVRRAVEADAVRRLLVREDDVAWLQAHLDEAVGRQGGPLVEAKTLAAAEPAPPALATEPPSEEMRCSEGSPPKDDCVASRSRARLDSSPWPTPMEEDELSALALEGSRAWHEEEPSAGSGPPSETAVDEVTRWTWS